ncbi:translation initiation factor 2 [Plantactinospora sonchi]|uniref:Translation initiation factor 2 n=1 Tax=Plantactinospora sonchi TaxID=1544735 RepID=A0ABU7RSJ9_9ACTN
MTTPSGDSADDAFWRRPTGPPADPPRPPVEPAGGAGPRYAGPPPSSMPPPEWQPALHVQPSPPRALPAQDLPALDTAESNARTLTYGIGMVGGAVVLVLMCLLCSRVLF